MPESSVLEQELSRVLGLTVLSQRVKGGKVQLRLEGLERPHGLSVLLRPMLSWVDATLEFDNLAKTLRDHVASSVGAKQAQFKVLLDSFTSLGARYPESTLSAALTNQAFTGIDRLSSRVMFDDLPTRDDALRVAASSILVPVLELAADSADPSTLGSAETFDEEGAEKLQWSRRYERSRANRAISIELHGTTCQVCGFSFTSFYGGLANDYVEIHHLTPVSSMEGPKVVDPRTELVPLCANCHRAAHRRWPPYAPDELRSAIAGQRN